jgi:hypothetical protein
MTRMAFRFIGHMAERSQGIMRGLARKNPLEVWVEAGVNVLELAGEILRYSETKKQTVFIQKEFEYVKSTSSEKEHIMKDHHEQILKDLKEKHLVCLKQTEKELQLLFHTFKSKVQLFLLEDEARLVENNEWQLLKKKMLRSYNDILSLCDNCIREEVDDYSEKQRLLEEYRIISTQMNKLMKEES